MALGLAALVLAWSAAHDALVQTLSRVRPDFALRLDPTDATALNAAFRRALGSQEMSAPRLHMWSERARASLRRSPLSASMVRMLATDPAYPHAERLLDTAEHISRRDGLMQLALIEAAVRADRIDDALRHYDRALSIYPDLRPALFPVLTDATAEPAVRRDLARLARRQRPWMDPFLAYAVRHTTDPAAIAALLADIGQGAGTPPDAREQAAVLVGRFAAQGDYAAARSVAMRAAGADAAWIDRPGFAVSTWNRSTRPLTWSIAETEGVSARLEGDDAALVVVGPGSSGPALFRVLVPRPGRYRFAATTAASPDGMVSAGGRWNMLCLRTGGRPATPLAALTIPSDRYGPAATILDVPADCPAVRIDFTIDNVDGGSDAAMMLRDVTLSPLR